jgi:hypothetical protein
LKAAVDAVEIVVEHFDTVIIELRKPGKQRHG